VKYFINLFNFFIYSIYFSIASCSGGEEENRAGTPEISVREIAAGRELFIEHGCASCHGETGRGDGPFGELTSARDLWRESSFRSGSNPDQIERSIIEGVSGSAMPSYPQLPTREVRLLAAYIRSFRKN
jgi:mono/diheme cytochrome c family protein